MPIACRNKLRFGKQFCITQCPVARPGGAFHSIRVQRPDEIPPAGERTIDVAVLDMNYGWPNLGHDSLVLAIMDAACDILPGLEESGLSIRVVSYEVRKSGMIPEGPRGRYALYLGTGGPGHLDPGGNDGVSPGSQGIKEDPSWEERLFALFDAIRADDDAALLSVCHTFGVMCRWAGVARPVLRAADKGGKSAGIQENVLTDEGVRHPWFRQLAEELPDGRSAARRRRPDRPRGARRRGPRRRGPDHDGVRAGPRRCHAPRLRREPPSGDRGSRAPDDAAEAEA